LAEAGVELPELLSVAPPPGPGDPRARTRFVSSMEKRESAEFTVWARTSAKCTCNDL
jgi:hypothetical protein